MNHLCCLIWSQMSYMSDIEELAALAIFFIICYFMYKYNLGVLQTQYYFAVRFIL